MSLFDFSGILGLVAVALCWVLSVVLFRVGAPGSVGRKLAVLLIVEGVTLLSNVAYLYLLDKSVDALATPDTPLMQALFIVHTIGDCAMLALYPAFLAVCLNTKLTRLFGGKRLRVFVDGLSVALFFAVLFSPEGIGATLLYTTLSALFTYAMVASIHAWRVAAPGIARDRARSFALAFSFRDICWSFVYGVSTWYILSGSELTSDELTWVDLIYRLGTLIYVPIVTYGILRTQLFDIDLRLRWTIKQSTVAGVFVAVMFVISEGASQFLSAELGTVTGLLAAGALVFFLAPLQRFADRVASSAMPNTKNTPEYATFRRMQVYEAAVADAIQDSDISEKERKLLGHLRDSLGISQADAEAIEQEIHSRDAPLINPGPQYD